MFDKTDILESLLDEIRIVKHLATKVPAGAWDFRPTEGQRSILETLRYLAFCGMGGAQSMVDGNFDGYHKWCASTENMSAEDIPAALDRQAEAMRELFDSFSNEDFHNKVAKHPMGHELPLGRALLEVPLKWMVGYRMQLFLFLKEAGASELVTPNCWGGVDPAPAVDCSQN
ncbi:MAG: DinB family protein [Planctomycetes bacterium]|nr:DinB family protein [Planctomycetota bacterium]